MQNPSIDPSLLETPIRRLLREHRRFGSWQKVADHHRVNVAYVYNLGAYGIPPANPRIQRALGIHTRRVRTLADIDRDMKLPISEMPADSLRAAFMFREVI